MAIDLRSLRSFVAVASAGSISAAAEGLHIAQPALSTQMKNLEDQLGSPLFDRHARGVTLTAVGERFLIHSVEILKRVDVAYTDIRNANEDPSGTVAIGLPQSIAKFVAVPLVQQAVERFPKVRLQMIEMSTGYIADQLLRGQIDVGLTFGLVDEIRIRAVHLLDEELVFVTSASGGAGKAVQPRLVDSISLAELAQFPIILPTAAHSLRRRIDTYLAQEKISLRIIAEVNTIPQLVELAGAGVGSTILSYAAVHEHECSGLVRTLRIREPSMTRPIYACQSATSPMPIAATKVQQLLQTIIDEQIASGQWLPVKRQAKN